jgi:urate oxidase
LQTFADHVSESVQHTLFDMAKAALAQVETLKEIHLVMPNKHRLLVDLSRFKLNNPNQIFVPTDEPSGYIEARITAD